MHNWRSYRINLDQAELKGHLFSSQDGQSELLELDEFVHMKVLKHQYLGTVADLKGYCKTPLRKRNLAQGTVWTCKNWAVLSLNNTIQEAWWMAK